MVAIRDHHGHARNRGLSIQLINVESNFFIIIAPCVHRLVIYWQLTDVDNAVCALGVPPALWGPLLTAVAALPDDDMVGHRISLFFAPIPMYLHQSKCPY